MTCLVTGGAGYIGGHMVLALLDAGHRVVVLDDLSSGFAHSVPRQAAFVTGDVGDADLVYALLHHHRIDAIFHFAARTIVPESFVDPLGYYLTNSVNTRTLLAAAVRAQVTDFVLSSTAAVYAGADRAVAEDDPVAPLSPYGRSKLMAEAMVRDAGAAHGLRYAILRYFNVAGADPAGRHGQCTRGATHLIKVAIETACGKRLRMEIYGDDFATPDGFAVRDYIHVSDLADAHLLALQRLRSGGDSFTANCGYGRGYSVKEVVDVVRTVSGRDFAAHTAPRRTGDAGSVIADSARLRSFGWTPRFDDLATIVSHAWRWEQSLAAHEKAGGTSGRSPPGGAKSSRPAWVESKGSKPASSAGDSGRRRKSPLAASTKRGSSTRECTS